MGTGNSCFFLFLLHLDPIGYLYRLSHHLLGIRIGRYGYMNDLRQLNSPDPSRGLLTLRSPTCPTPIHITVLAELMRYHPDQEYSGYILQGLSNGFRIGCFAPPQVVQTSLRNHRSSVANPRIISAYLSEEVAAGRMVGPLPNSIESIQCSPIGLVPKGRNTGRWRMIVDLSCPEGRSVNDGIAPLHCSLRYATVQDALQFITVLGRGTCLIKVDLKSAYRIVPVHPDDHHLLGVCWQEQTYMDLALPFGLRSAQKLFTAVADALGWALMQAGAPLHIHYLDDYLFFLPPGFQSAQSALSHIMAILDRLGVPISTQKIEGPAEVVTFLGIVIDTIRCELRLPATKLDHIRDQVHRWLGRRSGRYAEFESLLGHLSHATTVIRQGRIFLQHLFVTLASTRSRCHYVHLDVVAKADLLWWYYFLQEWNGSMFFPQPTVSEIHVYTDASGTFGCGGVLWPSQWFSLQWPASWLETNIAVKELVPVVIAAALWGRLWYRCRICFHVDNMSVVLILRKQAAASDVAHHILRCLYFYAVLFQFDYTAEHIPGKENVEADALSRNNIPLFSSLLPHATQVHIPSPLQELLITHRPDWGSIDWIRLFCNTLGTL